MTQREKIEASIKEIEEGTNFEIVTEMKAALNSVYGEERNQITKPTYETVMKRARETGLESSITRNLSGMERQSEITRFLQGIGGELFDYQIIIHFPEITITNGQNSHLIRNMYVKILLKPNGLVRSYIQGMRTTLTETEYMSQYVHSHLPRFQSKPIIFHNFCTGVGEINQVLAILSNNYTSANFMMLLMHIKNYLEWESKEGHPYMFMESIFKRSSDYRVYNSLPDYIISQAADKLVDKITETLTVDEVTKLFTFDVTERAIKVGSTLDGEKWMAKIITGWNTTELFGSSYRQELFLSLRDNEGNYHGLPDSSRRVNYERGPILNFKGKDIEFEVIERSQTQQHNETFANPKITKETCKKLSRELTKTALSSPRIKSGSSLNYNTGVAESDKLPM